MHHLEQLLMISQRKERGRDGAEKEMKGEREREREQRKSVNNLVISQEIVFKCVSTIYFSSKPVVKVIVFYDALMILKPFTSNMR